MHSAPVASAYAGSKPMCCASSASYRASRRCWNSSSCLVRPRADRPRAASGGPIAQPQPQRRHVQPPKGAVTSWQSVRIQAANLDLRVVAPEGGPR